MQDLRGRAALDDPAALHHGHVVGHVPDDRAIVADEQVGQMLLALAAYATYVINAGQFLYKLRRARQERSQ